MGGLGGEERPFLKRRRTDVRAEPGRIGATGIYGLTTTLRDFLLRRGLRNERKDKEYSSGSNIWSGNGPLSSHVRRPTPGRSGLHETGTLEGESRREETGSIPERDEGEIFCMACLSNPRRDEEESPSKEIGPAKQVKSSRWRVQENRNSPE